MDRPVVLASGSPRRRELLARLIPDFEVVVADVDEEALTVEDPFETAERLAQAKAFAVVLLRPEALVIGADTVVTLDGEQYAKPRDAADARRMLRALSGRTHVVATGVCVAEPKGTRVFHDRTFVTFRDLTDEEIAAYVATGEPMDKAGAYAIQGGAAGFVSRRDGSESNVIGLPLERLEHHL
jgi:septum formation protein